MERRAFLQHSGTCCALSLMGATGLAQLAPLPAAAQQPAQQPDPEKEFIKNWVTDLMDTLQDMDEKTQRRLMAGTGKACFRRHSFKTDIAADGAGSRYKLLLAMKRSFEVWEDGPDIHVRFGPKSPGCYCPAARYRPAHRNDAHCHCSRATQQAIFETALGHPVRVEILQSVRRGDPTCHFLVQGA